MSPLPCLSLQLEPLLPLLTRLTKWGCHDLPIGICNFIHDQLITHAFQLAPDIFHQSASTCPRSR